MRRDNLSLMRDAETIQHFHGMPHGVPIGLTAHDDGDQWLLHGGLLSLRERVAGLPHFGCDLI